MLNFTTEIRVQVNTCRTIHSIKIATLFLGETATQTFLNLRQALLNKSNFC
ncbi:MULTISPECIES: hypothetical protein [Enterobacteriaceae]|uniref:Uncharacterized protein n=2 Tax=Escherichia coli TaxID=562 RepID=A0A7G4EH37_ECOLX|nr:MULTISPECIES: hypothetical protein [Enterobacteriaceae]EKW3162370.1 hypothetical protein [Shigella dysenteriae]EFF9698451.1 hypothetical protein [Escherichia coli]EFH4122562.1 hypothetical protein [Escherichia coli]EFH4355928.1 hypothetical protein [Escherichia coli]EFH6726478.1 hypothetical protein [Escherichia coli]